MISELKRKSLPAIAKAVDWKPQPLHHFLANSPWDVADVRRMRIQLLLLALQEREIILLMKLEIEKGKTTDYVARQYIGNLGKLKMASFL